MRNVRRLVIAFASNSASVLASAAAWRRMTADISGTKRSAPPRENVWCSASRRERCSWPFSVSELHPRIGLSLRIIAPLPISSSFDFRRSFTISGRVTSHIGRGPMSMRSRDLDASLPRSRKNAKGSRRNGCRSLNSRIGNLHIRAEVDKLRNSLKWLVGNWNLARHTDEIASVRIDSDLL